MRPFHRLRQRVNWRIKQALRERGVFVTPAACPLISALDRIPPAEAHFATHGPETYYLPPEYRARTEPRYLDDTVNHAEYQREVYEVAKMLADKEGLETICDVGCGGAYKLLRWFADRPTIGIDLPETVKVLRKRHPGRRWLAEDLGRPSSARADLVIAADIIEHLLEPSDLLRYIASMQPRLIVLSTPDRNLMLNGRHNGPPGNPCHIREWTFAEFHRYISDHFQVLYHFYSNPFQACQMVVARPVQPSTA